MLADVVTCSAADPRRLHSMRRILSGGAPMALELMKRVEVLFPCEYVQTYGLTETSPYLTLSLLDDELRRLPPATQQQLRATTGRPMRGVDVRVVDRIGREVPRDGTTVGEIIARGPTVTPGYWQRPDQTAATIREGWLHTGDLAHVDQYGYLTIVDRLKDVINPGGELVYSIEVENVLYTHAAVREAAVIAVPDARLGEAVQAVVALRDGTPCDAATLQAHCRARLAGYKVPRDVVLVAALPRTGSGKINKRMLRERFGGGPGR
jgi:acyl-CoA synthetase (AMP-forming)/AMP-acid ligase II